MLEQLVVADDLSGAAESAGVFLLRTTRTTVLLSGGTSGTPGPAEDPRVLVIDTDSRHLAGPAAAEAVTRCVTEAIGPADGVRVVKKVDSLLRGNIAAEVCALAHLLGAVPVVATALPAAGRTVVDGVPLVHGRPLAATALWAAEAEPAPGSVVEVLGGLVSVPVPLAVVRDGQRLRTALLEAAADGRCCVCDAETDADLDAVVAAATALPNALLVGSAALVAAGARALPGDPEAQAQARAQTSDHVPSDVVIASDHVVVAVVGSAAASIPEQLTLLEGLGLPVLRLDPRVLLASPAEAARQVEQALATTGLVVALDHAATVEPAAARRLSAALAAAAAPAARRASVLLATGGETARAVLECLGVRRLTPLAVDDAVVRSVTPDGLLVLTRPGSHGTNASLRDAVAPYVAATTTSSTATSTSTTTSTAEPTQEPR